MDLRWGFNNIRIQEGDEIKAAFITPMGLFEPTIMQFGLCNAPSTFQRMVNEVLLEEKASRNVTVYIDDILVHTRTKEENQLWTRKVSKKLEANQLYCREEKCVFEVDEVEFLGVTIRQGSIKISKKKTEVIRNEKPLMTQKSLRRFLGITNYHRKFIKGYSTIARPLHNLTRDVPFDWTRDCQTAFKEPREALVMAPVLALPANKGKFRLETDALDVATGAVLYQLQEDGAFKPIGYTSKSYSDVEKGYTTYDKEMLGIMRGLEEWRSLLIGAVEPFKIMTDHQNLTYFQEPQKIWPYHDTPTAGHLGIKKTLDLMFRRGLSWPGIRTYVKEYVQGCLICQKAKPWVGPGNDQLHPMIIPGSLWEVMSWDLIGPLPESRTYNVIVTMVDIKTKVIKLEAANITIMVRGAAVVIKNRVFWEEGLPYKVISDRDPQFVSAFVKELYGMLGIKGNLSTAYHLQTDGQTERINREVEKYLRMFVDHWQDDWADWLPLAEFTYNNVKHEATGYSPFYLNRGRHPRALPLDPVTDQETAAGQYLKEICDVTRKAEESLKKNKDVMKRHWDTRKRKEKIYEEGDLMLVQSDYLPSTRISRKLDDKWRGPFHVLAKKGEAAYELELPLSWKGHWVLNGSRLKRFRPPSFPGQLQLGTCPNPIITAEGREEYEVEEILEQRQANGRTEYLVHWKDYGLEDDTWEPLENLKNAKEALSNFRSWGRDQGKVGYHVMAVTEEATKTSQTRLGLIHLPLSSQEGMNHWTEPLKEEQDSGTGTISDGKDLMMGKLYRRALVLIKHKVGADVRVSEPHGASAWGMAAEKRYHYIYRAIPVTISPVQFTVIFPPTLPCCVRLPTLWCNIVNWTQHFSTKPPPTTNCGFLHRSSSICISVA
jgi:hypothetical protein